MGEIEENDDYWIEVEMRELFKKEIGVSGREVSEERWREEEGESGVCIWKEEESSFLLYWTKK